MYGGMRMTTRAKARSMPWIELDGHRARLAELARRERVDEQVELDRRATP